MHETPEKIKNQVKERFIKVALDPQAKQRQPIGPESAKNLGYLPVDIDSLPLAVTESFAGVGNPLTIGEIRSGDTILDIGCGAGLDCLLAARKVGPSGRVIGLDMTEEMVIKARQNALALDIANVEFRIGEADSMPIGDGSVDVVISNGVFNLCWDKPKVLSEIHRVLRPDGRLQMADILLDEGATTRQVEKKGTWSD